MIVIDTFKFHGKLYRGKVINSSHLSSTENLMELKDFVKKLKNKPLSHLKCVFPHYDVMDKECYEECVKLGAVEVSPRELVRVCLCTNPGLRNLFNSWETDSNSKEENK